MGVKTFIVGELGLKRTESSVLKTLFSLRGEHSWKYELLEGVYESQDADIWVVDLENPVSRSMWRTIRSSNLGAVFIEVYTTQGAIAPAGGEALFVRPLRLPHLVKAMDEIVVKRLGYVPPIDDDTQMDRDLLFPAEPGTVAGGEMRYRALVVDDSPTIRTLMDACLRGLAIEPTLAEDADSALWQLGNSGFDIVFLDVVMPGNTDGYKLCKMIKAEPRMRRTPVILLTSKDSAFDRVRGKLSGADAYLTKPVNRDELVSFIRRYLKV